VSFLFAAYTGYQGSRENQMANLRGPQPDVKYCPFCKATLRNVARHEMKSPGHVDADGTVSEYTHTYQGIACENRFEINHDR
jgi:uncharacterized protein with PIN domain